MAVILGVGAMLALLLLAVVAQSGRTASPRRGPRPRRGRPRPRRDRPCPWTRTPGSPSRATGASTAGPSASARRPLAWSRRPTRPTGRATRSGTSPARSWSCAPRHPARRHPAARDRARGLRRAPPAPAPPRCRRPGAQRRARRHAPRPPRPERRGRQPARCAGGRQPLALPAKATLHLAPFDFHLETATNREYGAIPGRMPRARRPPTGERHLGEGVRGLPAFAVARGEGLVALRFAPAHAHPPIVFDLRRARQAQAAERPPRPEPRRPTRPRPAGAT